MEVFRGTMVHATEENPQEILQDHILGVQQGKIVFLKNAAEQNEMRDKHGFSLDDVTQLGKNEFLMPGMIDTHIHAPQYVFAGTMLGLPLLEWLQKYTFPTEAKFADIDYARYAYNRVVNRTLQNGTTTACYYATIHLESTKLLCDIISEQGQRGFVGKVNMDQNSPDFYIEETTQSIQDTDTFVQHVLAMEDPLLTPVVTPRFVPSCSSHLLTGLGEIAEKYQVPIQSHISETRPECAWVKELHPQCASYSDVYDKHGLLTDKSIMAHAVYLSDDELSLFRERNAGISHCPNSNLSLGSGFFDARRASKVVDKIGLGTDVSGGYSPSLLDAVRQCVQTASTIDIYKTSYSEPAHDASLYVTEAFRMATLGGSKVLGLSDRIGNFEAGKDFDALRITADAQSGPFDIFEQDNVNDVIHKFMFLGDDRNISSVYVAGRKVI